MTLDDFVMQAVRAEDVSVSLDGDIATCTCTAHENDQIESEPIQELAKESGCYAQNIIADFVDGEIRVEVVEDGE